MENENENGLKKNRDDILKEKKELEVKLKKFEAEVEDKEHMETQFKDLYEKSNAELIKLKRKLEFAEVSKKFTLPMEYFDAVFANVQVNDEAEKFFTDLKKNKPKLFDDYKIKGGAK